MSIIKKKILRLEISVSKSLGVDIVEGVKELLEVEAGDRGGESSCVCNEVKELSSWSEFDDHVKNALDSSVLLYILSVVDSVVDVNNALVTESRESIDFILRSLLGLGSAHRLLEDLHGIMLSSLRVLNKFNSKEGKAKVLRLRNSSFL
jgi:hypothetical protein